MNNNLKKITVLKLLTIIVLLTAVFMIIFYVCKFGSNGISGKLNDWSAFGNYFGAIGGLLAFFGVLYSASLSEESVYLAKKEIIDREDRDIFLKLVDLHKQYLSNDKYFIGEFGLTNKDSILYKINDCILCFFIYRIICSIDYNKLELLKKSDNILSNRIYSYVQILFESYYSSEDGKSKEDYFKNFQTIFIENWGKNEFKMPLHEIYIEDIDIAFSTVGLKLNDEDLNKILKNSAIWFFSTVAKHKIHTLCSTFENNLFYLDNTSLNKHKYYNIYSSQITSDIKIVLLLYMYYNDYKKEFIKNVIDYDFFSGIDLSQLIITRNKFSINNRFNYFRLIKSLEQNLK